MTDSGETRIQLCGRLAVALEGRRVEGDLPGRQGRLVFVYLAARRTRPVSRGELAEALWPEHPPSFAADAALSPILSRLRRALGARFLDGRSDLRLTLPPKAWIDLEVAAKAVHRAESAIALGDPGAASIPARVALHVAQREFLSGFDAPWIDEQRRALHDLRVRALEALAGAGLGLRGTELASAERSARLLVELEPYRESAYRLLMEVLAARDNVAEALLVYDRLRVLLREQLGIVPGERAQALHRRILDGNVTPSG